MKQNKYDYGLTTQRAVDQILKRSDNIYGKEVIRNVIKMYLEECHEQLMKGEKVNLEDISTIEPHIVTPISYGLTRANDSEVTPYIKMRFRTKHRLLEILKVKLNKNLKKGIKSLKEDVECKEGLHNGVER